MEAVNISLAPISDLGQRAALYRWHVCAGGYQCVSFHWSKILGIQQGGAILHDNKRQTLGFAKPALMVAQKA
jgi:hypothetical protein